MSDAKANVIDILKKGDQQLMSLLIKNIDKWFQSKSSDSTILIRYHRDPKEAIKDYLKEIKKIFSQ